MNILSYGDEVEKSKIGANNLELLVSDDRLSANSINKHSLRSILICKQTVHCCCCIRLKKHHWDFRCFVI